MSTGTTPSTHVWDPLVRFGHWILVAAFAIAYFTGDELLETHEWAGYIAGAYVIVRVIWGFVGSRHARFSDFLFGPRQATSYLADLVRGRALRYLGHSPAGSIMVFALLVMLSGTVITGLATLAAEHGEGPFAYFLPSYESELAGDNAAGEREESTLQEIHELFANLTLILIFFHIAGVITASIMHKENLVLSMITGRKKT